MFLAKFGVDTEESEPYKVWSLGWEIRGRFGIEPYSDFSAKWANFIGLVLFCIDAKFCNKIFVGKLLTRSTRFACFCTAQTSIFQQIFINFFGVFKIRHAEKFDFCQISSWFSLIFMKFGRIFSDFLEKRCNYSKYLDFNLILAWLYRIFI